MGRYETVVDPRARNASQSLEVELVGEDQRVLDVGCASGYLADALIARGCVVSGFEMDREAAEIARPKLERLVVGDLETLPLAEAFAGSRFDRIVFGDVLEHLTDPAAVLRSAVDVLEDDGEIVISVPNVTHGSLRLALLAGRWRYTETGLLDSTHIRFFTYDGLVGLLGSVGLVVREAWGTCKDPLRAEVEVPEDELPEGAVEWVRDQPHAYFYQFVVRASRCEAGSEPPEVRPAISIDEIRPDDRHSSDARERQAARSRQARRAARVGPLERELADARRDRDRVLASNSWRVGRAVTAPVRLLRRLTRSGRPRSEHG